MGEVCPCTRSVLEEFRLVLGELEDGHEVVVDGLTIPVIGRSEYLKNKRATGRMRDLADIEALGESAD